MAESMEFSHSEQREDSFIANVGKFHDDWYNWRKYGNKLVKGFLFTRSYYMCTTQDCSAKKRVLHSPDGNVAEISYKQKHNHQPPLSKKVTSNESFNMQESGQATVQHLLGTSERQRVGGQEVDDKNDEPDPKTRNTELGILDILESSRRRASEPRISVRTISDVDILDDGFKWLKYGQKILEGNPNPRSYYKCATPCCNIRKRVERCPVELSVVITTYVGKHNHGVPPPKRT